jgi:hypothetical protein
MTITDPPGVRTKRLRTSFPVVEFKAGRDAAGKRMFTALVAVYGNVDLHGDRIRPGAFDKSLAAWRDSRDPIPVIWSHNWADPQAYVGEIRPENAKSTERGLEVTGTLDDDPFAAKVHQLLVSRRVTQWSFAYDVLAEKSADDGVNDLVELGLIETGPTLKGANPMTDTVGVKAEGDTVTIPRDVAETVIPADMLTASADAGAKPDPEAAPADAEAVKAEAITRLTAMRDWATEQLKSLDPTIDPGESADLDLNARLEKARQELGL